MSVNASRARDYLTEHPYSTAADVAQGLGISPGAALRALRKLMRSWEVAGFLPDEAGSVRYALLSDEDGKVEP